MELEEITTEPEGAAEGVKETSEPRPEVKKEEEDVYSKLQSAPEDLYAEAQWNRGNSKTKAGNPSGRLWKGVSAVLAVFSVVLLIIIVVLLLKRQTGSSNGKNVATLDIQRCECHRCSKGWVNYGQSCYSLSTLRGTWDEGLKECEKKGGSLAKIINQEVQTFLLTKKGDLPYWIGLRKKGAWTWVGNSPLLDSFWADPIGNGDCVLMKNDNQTEKNWVMSNCNVKSYYICEKQIKN